MRLSHMSAAAVLVALVAAMFVALQSASAAACVANPGITLGIGDTCTLTYEDATAATGGAVSSTEATATVSDPTADGEVTITAVAIGTTTVTINDLGDDDAEGGEGDNADKKLAEFDVTVAGFALTKVEVKGDTDGTVSAGPQVTVVATLRSAVADTSQVRLTVPTTGLSIQSVNDDGEPIDGTTQQQTKTVGDTGGTVMLEFVVNTAGAPAGDYTLTFVADNDGDFATTSSKPIAEPDGGDADDAAKAERLENSKQASDTLTLTIGDPGTGLASATLSLGNSKDDLPFTDADESVAETGSAAADGGKINLVVEAFDSNGNKANSGSINQIIVIAPGGSISSSHLTGDGTATAGGNSSATLNEVDATPADDAETASDVGQKTQISVSKTDKKPGTVTVYAIVSGPGGAARTEDVTLTFSGPAASLMVADATESLLSVNTIGDNPKTDAEEDDFVIKDTIKLLVTAEDAGGNNAMPPTSGVSIVITDPDGKRKGTSVIERSQPKKGADGKYYITLTGMGSKATPLKAGNWTIEVKKAKLEASAMFAVAGAPADVAVSASSTSSDTIGDVITVTATVTDKDGNTVSDGTSVMFSVSEDTGLSAIGTGHKGRATKNGTASVKFAVVGAGNSVVSAEAGDATGVVVIMSTAGSTAAMEDRDPSLSDLSGTSGLVSYSGPDTTASTLMTLLAGRASAIWLSNNGSWVLYANVDGAMVPGSTDFAVTSGDVLYISN